MPRTWRLLRPSVSSIQRCGGSHHETSSKRMIEQVGSTGQAMCQLHVASEVLISAVWGPSLLFMHTCVHGYTCVHIYHTCTHVPLLTIRHCMIADAYCASPYSKDPCNISSRSKNRQIIWASQAMQIFPFSNGIAELRFAFAFAFASGDLLVGIGGCASLSLVWKSFQFWECIILLSDAWIYLESIRENTSGGFWSGILTSGGFWSGTLTSGGSWLVMLWDTL